MNKTPYFSIITPTLNSEKTIEATVRSVISQRFSSLEYIIIDGLSTDKTIYNIQEIDKKFIILQEVKLKSPVVTLISQKIYCTNGNLVSYS